LSNEHKEVVDIPKSNTLLNFNYETSNLKECPLNSLRIVVRVDNLTYDTSIILKVRVRVGHKQVRVVNGSPIYNTFSKRVVSYRVNPSGSLVDTFDPLFFFFFSLNV
jgi:hypothetical protein